MVSLTDKFMYLTLPKKAKKQSGVCTEDYSVISNRNHQIVTELSK